MEDRAQFVELFRNAAPYINAHRDRTFVVQFAGEAICEASLPGLIHDFATLHSLGIRLVLVHGARPQIERRLGERGIDTTFVGDVRVTTVDAMEVVKEVVSAARVQLEALLSMGIVNSPMAGARIPVHSGNFVIARPLGVRDGTDFSHTGRVRRIEAGAIERQLAAGAIVLLSPLGYSPTGEVFNLRALDVAAAVAVELRATKLILLTDTRGLTGPEGELIRQLTLREAKSALATIRRTRSESSALAARHLARAIHACRNGVSRTHILDRRIDGALLGELFTRDGVGTMVCADYYDATRRATIEDVGGILELIEPLERSGVLVRRSREKLENEVEHYVVLERDRTIIGCVAAHPFPQAGLVELACLAVHPRYRNQNRGERLLEAAEAEARSGGHRSLFVLTTQTTHWFKERGFVDARLEDLPLERRELYNYERRSKVLVKDL